MRSVVFVIPNPSIEYLDAQQLLALFPKYEIIDLQKLMWYFFSRARAHTPGRSSKWKMTFNNCLRKSMSSLVSFFLNIVFSRRAMKNEYFKKLISNYFFIDYYFFYFLPKAAFLYLVTCNFYFVGDGLAFDWAGHL